MLEELACVVETEIVDIVDVSLDPGCLAGRRLVLALRLGDVGVELARELLHHGGAVVGNALLRVSRFVKNRVIDELGLLDFLSEHRGQLLNLLQVV